MKREDVDTHSAHYYGPQYPAIRVKADAWPSVWKLADSLGISEGQAERASDYAFRSACEAFWEDIQGIAEDVFPCPVKVYSAGRSGGWMIVQGLSPLADWDAIALARWAKLSRIVREDIAHRCKLANVLEDIQAHSWEKEGSEYFNYLDTPTGTVCIADLKARAKEEGFGPVVRD